ncbi:MAG: branched-chain amino acid aminotransferase [Magnetovibrionaceae bacterium]
MGKSGAAGRALIYTDGVWREDGAPVVSPKSHAMWLSSVVFDGARAFNGVVPDLDMHCERTCTSARILGLEPTHTGEQITELAREGIAQFDRQAELYVCPMYYAESGFVNPDPASTRFALSVYESPLPEPSGFSAMLTKYRRPAKDMAPTEAKASCLYPNVARGLREVGDLGFDMGVVLDPVGNVAEFSYANLFMAKGGAVFTPAPNGTFLDGITRRRVIGLLRDAGIEVIEKALTFEDLEEADELFASGNYAKVFPCTKLADRVLQPGPLYSKARELYFDWARGQ